MSILARLNRDRLIELAGASDPLFVATIPEHVLYCSGYKSMGFDTDRHMQMAMIFDAARGILIGPKADLWVAREAIEEDIDYFSYGVFFFHDHDGAPGDVEFTTFGEALAAAIDQLAKGKRHVFHDRALDIPGAMPLRDGSGFFREARKTKNALEIDLLREVSALTERALAKALGQAKAGMSEAELAAIMSSEIIAEGALPGFIVVTSGERSAFADAYPSTRRLMPHDMVRIDIGAMLHGYWSDMARSAFVGEPRPDALKAFTAASAGRAAGCKLVKPGVSTDAIFAAAVEAFRASGFPDYRRHHVGHGLGIESHEYPTIRASGGIALEPGMVLSIETPYYRPGWGGVMTEDTLLVTDTGAEYFTHLSREPYIIPA